VLAWRHDNFMEADHIQSGPTPMKNQWHVTANAAELYEELLVPMLFKPWAEDLLALAALREGDRVLDVACGTGIVARMAAERVGVAGAVTGLDLNPGMIRVARSVPAPSGAPVTWVEGSALKMPLPDVSFDVVLCQQGFQFFPDQRAGLSEFRRVLVGGGRILLSVWDGETPYTRALSTAVERHAGTQAAATLRTSRICPNPDPLQLLVAQAGFRDVRVRARTLHRRLPQIAHFVLHHLAATPVADAVAALSEEARAHLADEARTALAQYQDGDAVVFPETAHVVIAVR
jgi:ubiquinone/menaquinone biosynthesis C-methylase UbiE